MNRPVLILYLEDDPRDAELVQDRLRQARPDCELHLASDRTAFEAALARTRFDLILSDFNLPNYDGMAALELARTKHPSTPFILLSGMLGEEQAVDCVLHGATDYVLKQRLDRLVPAVTRALAEGEERRKRLEAEASQTLLATAVAQAAESIVITDAHGTILYVNPAFERTSGYRREEAVGQNPRILKSGRHDAGFYGQLWTILARGEPWRGRFTNRRKDGTLFEEEATISPVRDATGSIVNYVAVKRDVSREVQLEAQFRQAQKMEAVGQLAGGVAHDFNNLLTVILMQVGAGAGDPHLSPQTEDALRGIRQAAERAAGLTRQLLLFSRRQVLQLHTLDVNQVVTNLAKMLGRILGEDLRLDLALHPTPLWAHADEGMLEQVLMNLAVNARDAMCPGGQLLIETAAEVLVGEQPGRSLKACPGPYVRLSVSDTGHGIPPEVMPHIFEPFFTTKGVEKGTGLGLATVFGIAEQHQGWVEVQSTPPQGTRFHLYLPATHTAPAPRAVAASDGTTVGGRETILLVEDDQAVLQTTRMVLEQHGYEVLEASSGLEALEVTRRAASRIDLLLTDWVLRGEMDGRALAEQMQAERPSLKVLLVSGYRSDSAGRPLTLQPGQLFLQKPFSAQTLLEAIRGCFTIDPGPTRAC